MRPNCETLKKSLRGLQFYITQFIFSPAKQEEVEKKIRMNFFIFLSETERARSVFLAGEIFNSLFPLKNNSQVFNATLGTGSTFFMFAKVRYML